MAINFIYDYPYCGYGEKGRFQALWSETRYRLNGCNVYPMVFNNYAPGVRHIKISIDIENTGSGTILGRSWDFMVCRRSGGWQDVQTFILPEDGKFTVDCDIGGYDITMFVFAPISNPGSSRSWNSWYDIEQLTITERTEPEEPKAGQFQYGVFANQSGLKESLNETLVNIGGSLKSATDVLVNIDGTLVSLPPVYSGHFTSSAESIKLFSFTVPSDGTYRIQNKRLSGDHELRLYDSTFTLLADAYFYSKSFALTGGALLYISVTHYYNETDSSESYLQIYKEE